MLDEDQRMMGVFEDGHELKSGEPPSDLQLREPPMQSAEDARKVACDIENFVSL